MHFISKNASPGVLLSDPEWLGRPSQEHQALRHRCLRHLSRPVPLIQAIKEAQEKSSTGPARRTFADAFLEVHFHFRYSVTALTASHSQATHGFEFMQPLVADMVQRDPSKRPAIGEVRSRFEDVRGSLGEHQLQSQIACGDEVAIVGLLRSLKHYCRTRKRALPGSPTLPTSSSPSRLT